MPTDALQPPASALEDPKVLLSWIIGALLAWHIWRERGMIVERREHKADIEKLTAQRIADREHDIRFRDRALVILEATQANVATLQVSLAQLREKLL